MAGHITPCFWFASEAEAAARHYVGIFDDAALGHVSRYGADMPVAEGTVLFAQFTLRGQPYMALNTGRPIAFNEGISLSVDCATQAEIDHHWDALLADGGAPVQCGWLTDRFGVSWQIVPRMMDEWMRTGTAGQVARLMAAMMDMVKLDIAALQRAFEGE
ncbi:VOC family protein [Polymorphobacter fuscus]|uniref:VOC family protein n=1 Tax=Sandarakinorhabdus fusca TaxID=1439888 RepID=A0A7C9LGC3_9SPHN|nr:VOC family protein [Polymorphobacter fuscus]KAB7646184.1 VOC family protein [Polymorphobacter fuscus]MQT17387.1 VOC family protein [Polymorphobacter fuscus]NJC10079.1 putative 3-demethylubiquinone-9 3-methyltransferase (glyoxalase superfamily) [Polymorphobacter fuscus]